MKPSRHAINRWQLPECRSDRSRTCPGSGTAQLSPQLQVVLAYKSFLGSRTSLLISITSYKSWYVYYLYLFWWGGHCCPMHCDVFKNLLCSPEFRYYSDMRPIFSASEVQAWNLRLGTLSLKSLSEDLWSGFLRSEKIHRPQPGLRGDCKPHPHNVNFRNIFLRN